MSGTIYTATGAGTSAANGDYVESEVYFANGRPLYINSTDDSYWMENQVGFNKWYLSHRLTGTGYGGGDGFTYTNLYFQDATSTNPLYPDSYPWSKINGTDPAPTVTLKSGSVEPASNMVLAGFL